tara:strand:- start:122 stop:367 length:246 start_codon:yes stop_codon:yes gene_type:complete
METDNNKSLITSVFEQFSNIMKQAGPYMAASYTLVGAVIGLSLLGYFLDRLFDTKPWLLLSGILLGVVIGLYGVAKVSLNR